MTSAFVPLLTALVFLCLAQESRATPAPSADAPQEAARRELRQVIFGSSEVAGGSVFLGSGFKRALAGSVDAQGPIMMSLSGAGATGESFAGPAGIRFVQPRLSQSSALLFGYQWMGEFGVLMLAAGPEIAREQQLDRFGMPRWQPARRGVGFIAEVWTEPWSQTMAQATLTVSGARGSIWGRVAAGYAPFERVFLGPEISAYMDDGYEELRFGLHLTGLTLGPFTFRLNGGILHAPGRRDETYFGFQTYFKI
ncbi:MAG: cellulose biosynthesis protein BcsS [Salinarimonadaceae bacterium]|nr:MAG: cellulose biosynthesis protein BcsS [Salinarimonadaceae bacterium]